MKNLSHKQIENMKSYLKLGKDDQMTRTFKSIIEALEPDYDPLQGKQGGRGEKGEKGEKGDQGEQGIPGEKGEPGENGKDGKDGIDGKDGKDGRDGRDGLDGRDGENGKDGEKGESGKDGIDGKDGSPDTPEQIANKLQTLKEAWLEISKIKGLKELLEETGNTFLQQARGFVPNALTSLYDTQLKGISNGQTIVWSSALQKFIPGSAGSDSVSNSFETMVQNLDANPYSLTYDGSGNLTLKTWTTSSGSVTATYTYTDGDLTSMVLAGALPTGIMTTKTYSYDGSGELQSVTYS